MRPKPARAHAWPTLASRRTRPGSSWCRPSACSQKVRFSAPAYSARHTPSWQDQPRRSGLPPSRESPGRPRSPRNGAMETGVANNPRPASRSRHRASRRVTDRSIFKTTTVSCSTTYFNQLIVITLRPCQVPTGAVAAKTRKTSTKSI